MGNSLGGRKTAKIMKINGETVKFKTPIQAKEVLKDYPGHVLLDPEAVKQFGIRAKPLDPIHNLKPRRFYFLVELPKLPHGLDEQNRAPRRVQSGINLSAKDRLDSLMLARRSVSDLSIMGPATRMLVDGPYDGAGPTGSGLRVRMRVPKTEVDRLMSQCREPDEAAEKIVGFCIGKTGQDPNDGMTNNGADWKGKQDANNGNGANLLNIALAQRDGGRGRPASYKKQVGFMPTHEAEIGLVVASS